MNSPPRQLSVLAKLVDVKSLVNHGSTGSRPEHLGNRRQASGVISFGVL